MSERPKVTEAQARVLVAVDEAGSAVVQRGGRLLAGGEFIRCMPETPLALMAWGYLTTDTYGRLSCTERGKISADVFRNSRAGQREASVAGGQVNAD